MQRDENSSTGIEEDDGGNLGQKANRSLCIAVETKDVAKKRIMPTVLDVPMLTENYSSLLRDLLLADFALQSI